MENNAPFTPETLRNAATTIEAFRVELLFGVDAAGADPDAEQHYLSALAYMELAHRALTLAANAQTRALTARRR